MFRDWENFYLLIGSAGGALIGLLFVVASLSSGLERSKALRGASIYLTPIVFHLGVVLVVSAVAMTPRLGASLVGPAVVACALLGLVYAVWVVLQIRKVRIDGPPHWTDLWCYGVAPAAIYLGLAAAALAAWTGWSCAPYAIAAALLALLLVSIRNAWDLVTWLAPRKDDG